MDELIRKAEELGTLLARSDRFRKLIEVRDAVRADVAASKLLQDYDAQVRKVQKLAVDGKPIEVGDKHRLAEIEKQLAGSDTVKAFAKAQADFSEMMSKINQAIYGEIAPDEDEGEHAQ